MYAVQQIAFLARLGQQGAVEASQVRLCCMATECCVLHHYACLQTFLFAHKCIAVPGRCMVLGTADSDTSKIQGELQVPVFRAGLDMQRQVTE